MLRLLHIEWLKIKNYRTFWILSSLFALSLYGANYIGYQIQLETYKQAPIAEAILGAPPFQFPEVWHTVAWISSFLLFFPGLIIIILMTNEFSYKTHRQNIIDGLSRSQFIYVKMVLCVLIAAVSTILVEVVSVIFGMMEAPEKFTFQGFYYMGYFFTEALSYTSLALVMAVLFRRSGIAIGVYFLYAEIIDQTLQLITSHYFNNAGHFFPLESNDQLLPWPFIKNVASKFLTPTSTSLMLATAAVYLALYFFICKRKFETADL